MSDFPHWLMATGIVLLASSVQGLTGFGFAILAVPLLTIVEEPHEAITVCMVLSTISVVGMWWVTRRQERLPISGRLFAAALFGLPAGLLVLDYLEADWLKLTAGLATLAVTVVVASMAYSGVRKDPGTNAPSEATAWWPRATLPAGVASGVLAGCLSMPGPPVVALLSGGNVPKTVYRATLLTFFALIYPAASIAMCASGLIGRHDLAVGLSHLPALDAGAWLGDILHGRIRDSAFTNLSLVLLAASGAACVWAAASSLMAS
jgi:uncharacterized membrane protein YfcA